MAGAILQPGVYDEGRVEMMTVMAPPTVRRALGAEVDEIEAVIRAANAVFEPVLPADFFRSYLDSALDVRGRMAVSTVLVAEVDGAIVGTVTAFDDANDEGMPIAFPPGTAGLRATAVHPDVQGHGIGRTLVDACTERARRSGALRIGLHTAPFMTAAISLYERSGFRRAPDHDFPATDFFPSAPRADLVAMAFVRSLA